MYPLAPSVSHQRLKRAFDILCSGVGLLALWPVGLLIGLLIKLSGRGPIFYGQTRIGQFGNPFRIWKFRSMVVNADNMGVPLTKDEDPRITWIGRFLRKAKLDELPQLWNVLRGEMSLVGPRPERPELLENLALAIPFFEERMRNVKPGITGLAQVSLGYTGRAMDGSEINAFKAALTNPFKMEGADDSEADDMRMKMLYDLAYSAALEQLESYLSTELSVIAKTPLVMLRGLGR